MDMCEGPHFLWMTIRLNLQPNCLVWWIALPLLRISFITSSHVVTFTVNDDIQHRSLTCPKRCVLWRQTAHLYSNYYLFWINFPPSYSIFCPGTLLPIQSLLSLSEPNDQAQLWSGQLIRQKCAEWTSWCYNYASLVLSLSHIEMEWAMYLVDLFPTFMIKLQ